MLTLPSDSLPQIVCPMDEDAIPPNPFCSAPPHSEPSPPLLPLSSVTPSCADDGLSAHRRSGRIQGIRAQTPKKQSEADSEATQKPSRPNPSPANRQRESGSMVQVSQSKPPRVESSRVHEKQHEDGLDFSFAAEGQNKHEEQNSPRENPHVSVSDDVVEQVADAAARGLDMDTCGGLALGHTFENASAPKGWVIGPLFQSFKSKMASFTEIVMTPVKLLTATSPPPLADHEKALAGCKADGSFDAELSSRFWPAGQSETGQHEEEANQQRFSDVEDARNAKSDALKYCKKLVFDTELSGECAVTQTERDLPDSVPLQDAHLPRVASKQVSEALGSPPPLEPPLGLSAPRDSEVTTPSAVEEEGERAVRLKPPPRKRTGNRSELKNGLSKTLTCEVRKEECDPEVRQEQLSQRDSVRSVAADRTRMLSSSVCCTQPDTGRLQPDGDGDGIEESCGLVRRSLWNDANDGENGRTLRPASDARHPGSQLICDAAGLGRSKRQLKQPRRPQELVKRKKLTADVRAADTKIQESSNAASDSGRGLRSPSKEVVSTDAVIDGEETLKPRRRRQAVSTRAKRKGNGGQETLPAINEGAIKAETAPDAMLVCSLDRSSDVSGNSKRKPSGSCKRLKTRAGLGKPDVNVDGMDLETASTGPAREEPRPDALVRPDRKQLHSGRCGNVSKKPPKRKSPSQASSAAESVSTPSPASVEPSELTPADLNASPPVAAEENQKTGLIQPSKRSKKGLRGSVKPSESGGSRETEQCVRNLHLLTKESRSKEGKAKISTDPVYFEMTPFENDHQPVPLPPQPHLECYVQLKDDVHKYIEDDANVADEASPSDLGSSDLGSAGVSRPRPGARRLNRKPGRAENQRRRCRVLHSRTHKPEEATKSITMEDADLASAGARSSEKGFSRRLLRSHSCPEIPSLRLHDAAAASAPHSPQPSRAHASHQSPHAPLVPHFHKVPRRARRHTVCSLEVEREIAPLCLRKEVYPSRRSAPYDGVAGGRSPGLALSPSTSLSALASVFLSSPLAFLSKRADSRGAAASPSTSSHVSSPTSSSSSCLTSPLSSSTWHLPGFLQRSDSSHATSDSLSRVVLVSQCLANCSGNPLEREGERRQQSEEEEDDGEDTSSSSQEYEDVGLREEKALSDSEIKVVQKHEERGKVSSIRIRKALPKPQNNLTPMGLPKPIRPKKKEFSLEEIYTNKNYRKPPDRSLETIFEVPLNRRNGTESRFGQRRVKRCIEFPEVGEARKPKKPLVGVGKAGVLSSRTRRGSFAKDEPSLSAQDVDSLLCAKLDQLSLWLMRDQTDS